MFPLCSFMSVALSVRVVQHCEIRQRCCDSDLAGQHPWEFVCSLFVSGSIFYDFFLKNWFFFPSICCLPISIWTFLWILLNLSLSALPPTFQFTQYVTLFAPQSLYWFLSNTCPLLQNKSAMFPLQDCKSVQVNMHSIQSAQRQKGRR